MKKLILILLCFLAFQSKAQRVYTLNYDTVKVIGSLKVVKQPPHSGGVQQLVVRDTITGEYKFIRTTEIGGGGGGAVNSVFGRAGNVTALSTDYSAFYPLLTGSYTNPSWIVSLPYSKITGTPTIYTFTGTTGQLTRGDGTYITNSSDNITEGTTNLYYTSARAALKANVSGQVFTGAISATNLSGTNTGDQTTAGTTNRISVTNGSTSPIIDISANYVGQTSITTLGTIGTGSIPYSLITGAPTALPTPQSLQGGYGIVAFSFNGNSSGIKVITDTTLMETIANLDPRIAIYGDTRYLKIATATATYQTLANLDATVTNSSTKYPSSLAVQNYATALDTNYVKKTGGADALMRGDLDMQSNLTKWEFTGQTSGFASYGGVDFKSSSGFDHVGLQPANNMELYAYRQVGGGYTLDARIHPNFIQLDSLGALNSGGIVTVNGFNLDAGALTPVKYYLDGHGGGILATTNQITFKSLTTTGTSGAATLVGGILNIPQYSGGGGSGTVTSVGATVTNSNGIIITGTSPITTSGSFGFQVDSTKYQALATKGQANGYTPLKSTRKVDSLYLPDFYTSARFIHTGTNNNTDVFDLATVPVAFGGTGAVTLTGLVKGNGTSAFTAAAAGTDYVAPTTTVAGFALSSNVTLANLTATNSTLTFSGTYTGATARTIGLNLATANTWTGLQTFNAGISVGLAQKVGIVEGTGGRTGQTALVAGTKAITITGLTTSSRAFVQLVTPGGTSLTIQYQAVCTANTLTIQANVAAGTINVSDTSTLNYFIVN